MYALCARHWHFSFQCLFQDKSEKHAISIYLSIYLSIYVYIYIYIYIYMYIYTHTHEKHALKKELAWRTLMQLKASCTISLRLLQRYLPHALLA